MDALTLEQEALKLTPLSRIRLAELLYTSLKGTGFINGLFPLPVVFWTFLRQVLANGSCRHGVASLQSVPWHQLIEISHRSRHKKPADEIIPNAP